MEQYIRIFVFATSFLSFILILIFLNGELGNLIAAVLGVVFSVIGAYLQAFGVEQDPVLTGVEGRFIVWLRKLASSDKLLGLWVITFGGSLTVVSLIRLALIS